MTRDTRRAMLLAGPLTLGMGLALLWLRQAWERGGGGLALNPWTAALALVPVLAGCQRILRAVQAREAGAARRDLAWGLHWSFSGWFLLALALPGRAALLGALNFLFLHALVKAPLMALVLEGGWTARWLVLAGFFAAQGLPPFATYSAYFQAFVPLMGTPAGVQSLHGSVVTREGLAAALAMLALTYQAGALGYLYWKRVLPGAGRPGPALAGVRAWTAASLGLAAAAGLFPSWYAAKLAAVLELL